MTLDRLIRWLGRHWMVTVVISGVYFAAVVLPHEEVSRVSLWLQARLSLRLYDKVISAFGVAAAAVVVPFAIVRIRRGEGMGLKVFYWCFTGFLVWAAYNALMVVGAESIHFPQYAVLAVPLFALTRSFGVTILAITLLGAVDEAHQFFVLKNWKYLDFNDIVLNLVGGGIGLLFVYTFSTRRSPVGSRPLVRLLRSPVFLVTAVLMAAAVVLHLLGKIALYPGPDAARAWIVLSNVAASETFWIHLAWGTTYHILTPVEGLTLWVLLSAGYASMDFAGERDDDA